MAHRGRGGAGERDTEVVGRRVIFSTYNNIASIYYIFHDTDKARQYIEKAFNSSVRVKDWHLAMVSLQNLMEINLCGGTVDSLMPFVRHFGRLNIRPRNSEYRYLIALCHAMTLFSGQRFGEAATTFKRSVALADDIYQSDSRKE